MKIFIFLRVVVCLFFFNIFSITYAKENLEKYIDVLSSDEIINLNYENHIGLEIFEAALNYCGYGDFVQADILFDALLIQLDPPLNVKNVIEKLKEKKCIFSSVDNLKNNWGIRLGAGYESNVTQGISSKNIILGNAESQIELLLDDVYLPRSSVFQEISFQKTFNINDSFQMDIKGMMKNYSSLPIYNQIYSGITLAGKEYVKSAVFEWALEHSDLWLNDRYYYSGWLGAMQISTVKYPHWRGSFVFQKLKYADYSSQNSHIFNIGILRSIRMKEGELQLSLGWLKDKNEGLRAGGGRQGPSAAIQLHWPVKKWVISGKLGYTKWLSRDEFLPGLITDRRQNNSLLWLLNAEYELAKKESLQINLFYKNVHDNIPLYKYNNFGLMLNMQKKF